MEILLLLPGESSIRVLNEISGNTILYAVSDYMLLVCLYGFLTAPQHCQCQAVGAIHVTERLVYHTTIPHDGEV